MHVRQIAPHDRLVVDELLTIAPYRAVQVPWNKLPDLLFRQPTFVAEQAGEVGCVLGLSIEPETVARLTVFVLRAGWPPTETLTAMLPAVRDALRKMQVTMLAHLGVETWSVDALLANDFEQTDTIITLQKTDFSVPAIGNTDIHIRPAIQTDLPALVEIDRAAFTDRLWHHTVAGLSEYGREAAFMLVAEDDRPVGYAYGTVIGRHGHLSRIAVHPAWQGRRIGVRLLAESIACFQGRHVFGITLNTQSDNTRSRRLYDWFGFQVLGLEAFVLRQEIFPFQMGRLSPSDDHAIILPQ